MKIYKILAIFILAGIMFSSTIVNADPYLAFGGEISQSTINKGDKILFTGSIFNNNTADGSQIISINISFIPYGTTEIAANLSKLMSSSSNDFLPNSTFTYTGLFTLDLEPGSYNISIYFDVKNPDNPVPNAKESYYSLVGGKLLIQGTSAPIQFIEVVSILLGIGVLIFALIVIRGKLNTKY